MAILSRRQLTQTCQCVDSINVHRTAPANPLATASPERQCRVHLVLDPDQSVQHHWSGLVEIKAVLLHFRLRGRLVRVPSVDLEGLHLGLLRRARVLDGCAFGRGLGCARAGGHLAHGAEGFALGVFDRGGHAAAEDEGGGKAPCC